MRQPLTGVRTTYVRIQCIDSEGLKLKGEGIENDVHQEGQISDPTLFTCVCASECKLTCNADDSLLYANAPYEYQSMSNFTRAFSCVDK